MDQFHTVNLGQIILALIVLAGQIHSTISKRRLQKENRLIRAEEHKERERVAAQLLAAQSAAAAALAELTEMRAQEIHDKIVEVKRELDVNTKISAQAFIEANNFNLKFKAMQEAESTQDTQSVNMGGD